MSRGAVAPSTCDELLTSFSTYAAGGRISAPSDLIRDVIGPNGPIGSLAVRLGGSGTRAVRILTFDKTPECNWKLGWHQDRVIAVKQRVPTEGFNNWTEKHGVLHVEPPEQILREMFSLRLHLDDCGPDNAPLKVVSGSHAYGRVAQTKLLDLIATAHVKVCTAKRGDILAMQALTFHASDAAVTPTHRRVLHVDFATCSLPTPLEWAIDQPI